MSKFSWLTCLTILFLFFQACDNTQIENQVISGPDITGLDALDSGQTIKDIECDSSILGKMAYDTDFGEAFYCNGNSWIMLRGLSGKNGVDGKNGINGVDGIDGISGENGKFCTVLDLKTSIYIACDADTMTVQMEWNIEEGCSITASNDTMVTMSCNGENMQIRKFTIPGNSGSTGEFSYSEKKSCADTPLDTTKYFCKDNELIPLCSGNTYDIENQVCFAGTVINKEYHQEIQKKLDELISSSNSSNESQQSSSSEPIQSSSSENEGSSSATATSSPEEESSSSRVLPSMGDQTDAETPILSSSDAATENSSNNNSVYEFCGDAEYNTAEQVCRKNILYDIFVDERDGQKYLTRTIEGVQIFAQNLNYIDSIATPSLQGNAYCSDVLFDFQTDYGCVYAMNIKAETLCPAGWDYTALYTPNIVHINDTLNFQPYGIHEITDLGNSQYKIVHIRFGLKMTIRLGDNFGIYERSPISANNVALMSKEPSVTHSPIRCMRKVEESNAN